MIHHERKLTRWLFYRTDEPLSPHSRAILELGWEFQTRPRQDQPPRPSPFYLSVSLEQLALWSRDIRSTMTEDERFLDKAFPSYLHGVEFPGPEAHEGLPEERSLTRATRLQANPPKTSTDQAEDPWVLYVDLTGIGEQSSYFECATTRHVILDIAAYIRAWLASDVDY